MKDGQSAINFFTHDKFGSNQEGSAELEKLFKGNKVFDNPKPTKLLKSLINIASDDNAIILDFFAGSGSIAHAFIEYEAENPSNRKYILCQLPHEITDDSDAGKAALKLGFKRINELTVDRIRRVIAGGKYEIKDQGFKYIALRQSNYKIWKNISGNDVSTLQHDLNLFNQEPLIEGWKSNGLLSEILLLEGFVLSSSIEKQSQYKKNEVLKASDEYCEHSLLVCLDKEIKPETIKALEFSGNDIFICLDSAISNVDKLKLSDKGLIKTI